MVVVFVDRTWLRIPCTLTDLVRVLVLLSLGFAIATAILEGRLSASVSRGQALVIVFV